MLTSDRQRTLRETCPACGTKGKAVQPITIESLVVDKARRQVGRTDGFRFCAASTCEVAYFHPETGARISKDEIRVRIGQKATESPRPACYCFEHSIEEIEADVLATGRSKVADDITEKCRQGLDRCEETNPKGSCCLGNVRRVIQEAQARRAGQRTAVGAASDGGKRCCAVADGEHPSAGTRRRRNAGLWTTAGAVLSAILSSVCCWLPLLLIAFGASAGGVAGVFEAYRPWLLGATGLLLAGSFYLVYFRKGTCGPGEACAVPNSRLKRLNKIMLWAATTAVVAFAFFPNYVGRFVGNGRPSALSAASATGDSRAFRIDGLTCEPCAVALSKRLETVPGVARAEVSFGSKIARVSLASGLDAPSDEALLAAISEAGYSGTPESRVRTVRIAVGGMTCAGCARGLEAHLRILAGVEEVRVDDESARATIAIARDAPLDAVLEAIAGEGFKGRVVRESE